MPSLSRRSNSFHASWIAASWLALRRTAASPAASISMPMRTSSTLSATEILLELSAPMALNGLTALRHHEHPCALTRLDHPIGRERCDSFANHCAADAENRGQLDFGRQLGAGAVFAGMIRCRKVSITRSASLGRRVDATVSVKLIC